MRVLWSDHFENDEAVFRRQNVHRDQPSLERIGFCVDDRFAGHDVSEVSLAVGIEYGEQPVVDRPEHGLLRVLVLPDRLAGEGVKPRENPREVLRDPHHRIGSDTADKLRRPADGEVRCRDRMPIVKVDDFAVLMSRLKQQQSSVVSQHGRLGRDTRPLPNRLAICKTANKHRGAFPENDVLTGHQVERPDRLTVAIGETVDAELSSLSHQKDRAVVAVGKALSPELNGLIAGNVEHDESAANARNQAVPGTEQGQRARVDAGHATAFFRQPDTPQIAAE